MKPFLAALPLLASTALGQVPSTPAGQAGGIPPIQAVGNDYILTFDETGSPQDSLNLEQFVKQCQKATGLNFTYTPETAGVLQKAPLRLFGSKRIRKDDFYQFFQVMMIINDFVCSEIGPKHMSVILIQSLTAGNNRNQVRNDAVYVPPTELERYADQPAVLINTVIDLPNTDVRQLSNSMRTMFVDAQTQQIIPVGNSNSVVITGFGSNVVGIVRMLRLVDDAAKTNITLPEFELIPLEFASAEDVSETLQELLEASRRATQSRGAQNQAVQGATGQLQLGQSESKILVETRSNSLIVMAMPEDMPRIKDLVARLDVDTVQSERTYRIYTLENVAAKDLAETLDDFIRDAARVAPGGGGAGRGGAAAAGGATATSAQRNEIVVVADEATNSLLIAANRSRYEELLDLIKRLDIRQDQVLIETALVELSGQGEERLSIELGLAEIASGGDGAFGVSNFGLATFEDTNGDGIPDIKRPNASLQGITAGILSGDDFSLPLLLNALKTKRDTNVLNVPSVLVNNNKSAKVTSKDAQPTTTITATGGGVGGQTQENFKEYVEAGITMEISPTISASRYLRLNISLEISNFLGAVSGAIPPPKTTRTIQTQVNVPDGDTMVIGGIITDNRGTSRSSVPFLGDIPLVGRLFSSDSSSSAKTTLYFFVTPHIMRDRDFADLAEYSFQRKLTAADTIGADRIRMLDPSFGREAQGVDLRGFEVPLYRGPLKGEVKQSDVGMDAAKFNALLEKNEKAAAQVELSGDEKP